MTGRQKFELALLAVAFEDAAGDGVDELAAVAEFVREHDLKPGDFSGRDRVGLAVALALVYVRSFAACVPRPGLLAAAMRAAGLPMPEEG